MREGVLARSRGAGDPLLFGLRSSGERGESESTPESAHSITKREEEKRGKRISACHGRRGVRGVWFEGSVLLA